MALLGSELTDEKDGFAAPVGYYDEIYVILTTAQQGRGMDDLDRMIISLLSQDARMSLAVLARRLKIARSTVQARLERLETNGAITGYTLRLGDAGHLTRIRATVLLTIEPRALPGILMRLKALPQVERIHTTSGRVDLLLQLTTATTTELDEALDRIGGLDGVRASESLIHLSTKLDRAV